jgi:type 1 fimbriae regulatory protein FimB/type 1 fimbriae regulatory protein FimE
MRSLRAIKRGDSDTRYVFMTERDAPITAAGFRKMLSRLAVDAKFQLSIHPHMLRHACGFKLANDGSVLARQRSFAGTGVGNLDYKRSAR